MFRVPGRSRSRVPDAVQRSSRCSAEPGPKLEALKQAVAFIDRLAGTVDKAPINTDATVKFKAADIVRQLKEQICHLEIKGSDAGELGKLVDQMFDTEIKDINSADGFLRLLSGRTKSLIEIRASKGRGAETNIAVWKLVSAAVSLALAIWVVYKCYYSPWRCSKKEKAIYNSRLAVAMIVFGACE
jgi:hypothetical protein